jgi:hypothetical protein
MIMDASRQNVADHWCGRCLSSDYDELGLVDREWKSRYAKRASGRKRRILLRFT